MQTPTFNISAADMASLLLLLTAVEDIINHSGTVTDETFEELELIYPELEKLIFSRI